MDQEIEIIHTKAQAHDEILLAALKLFAEKGYFHTSLTDIAGTAEIKNTSAIYQHFKNKQVIAAQLYTDIFDSLNNSVDDIRLKNERPVEQLRGIVDLLFRLADDAPDVLRFLLNLKLNEFLPEEKPTQDTAAYLKIIKIIEIDLKKLASAFIDLAVEIQKRKPEHK